MPVRSKQKTVFFCQECGYESAKWLGQCPACHNWNSFVEEKVSSSSGSRSGRLSATDSETRRENRPKPLSAISTEAEDRLVTGLGELDRVLGGGIVPGSLMLIGGDPGIGKSTLLLQVCKNLCNNSHKVLYVSGEESLRQIALRAERIGDFSDSLEIFCETSLERICDEIKKERRECVVIDSIQTMCNEEISASPGSVSQVRETTGILLRLAKENNISIFIVGHVTKEGAVAGPKVLEHIVDTVLYFEGEAKGTYRIIRSVKNRFGSTDEIGVFEMSEAGLKEVLNPSEFMLSGRPKGASGSVVACCMEGKRPIMVEIQALVCDTAFNIPRRQAMGTDYNRLNLLLAVLEKRVGLRISNLDAYLNIAGGLKINEPALDLAIIAACVSSFKNIVLDEEMVVFGEVGLSGEVRAVTGIELRINEAARLGFKRVILPSSQLKGIRPPSGLELTGVKSVADLMEVM